MPPSDRPQNDDRCDAEPVEQRDHVGAEVIDAVRARRCGRCAEAAMVVEEQAVIARRADAAHSHIARVVPSELLITSIGLSRSPSSEYASSTLMAARRRRGARPARAGSTPRSNPGIWRGSSAAAISASERCRRTSGSLRRRRQMGHGVRPPPRCSGERCVARSTGRSDGARCSARLSAITRPPSDARFSPMRAASTCSVSSSTAAWWLAPPVMRAARGCVSHSACQAPGRPLVLLDHRVEHGPDQARARARPRRGSARREPGSASAAASTTSRGPRLRRPLRPPPARAA